MTKLIDYKHILCIAIVSFCVLANFVVEAQELNCVVEVNSQAVQGTDKSVFSDLQQAISDYFNTQKWTDTQIAPNEKIDCRFF